MTLAKETVSRLFDEARLHDEYKVTVDLEKCDLTLPDGTQIIFTIESSVREKLLNGWDDIGLTLNHASRIREFEESRQSSLPWLFSK